MICSKMLMGLHARALPVAHFLQIRALKALFRLNEEAWKNGGEPLFGQLGVASAAQSAGRGGGGGGGGGRG